MDYCAMKQTIDVLVVDKSLTSFLLVDELEKLGCHVDLIQDEVHALQKTGEHQYDILFINVWIQHENSGIQLISLIKKHAKINENTLIYAIDFDSPNEFIETPESHQFIYCIHMNHPSKLGDNIKGIIANYAIKERPNITSPLLHSEKNFLLAKALELIGNTHVLLVETTQHAKEIIKSFSNSPCDIDIAFDYEAAQKKLALNKYDFILIDLDTAHLLENEDLVSFARNFCDKNIDTTIFGFSKKDDQSIQNAKNLNQVFHVTKFPFQQKDIDEMIKIARWKIDLAIHKHLYGL